MDSESFVNYRKQLGKTQKQMAELLGTSIKAVHSYEQGWRSIPPHVERQVYFLLSRRPSVAAKQKNCWTIRKCPKERKKNCPAYEFNSGRLCWLINGTICEGVVHKNWAQKMETCRNCAVLKAVL